MTRIEDDTFFGCGKLQRLYLPPSLTYFSNWAIYYVFSLTEIFGEEGTYAEQFAHDQSLQFYDYDYSTEYDETPILSQVSVSDVTETTATLKFSSDEAGTYYYLVYAADDTTPDASTIKAQGSAAALGTGTCIMGPSQAGLTGLTKGTNYIVYLIVEDSTGKISMVANRAFTTTGQAVDECFIATAAFGSKFDWPVTLLRHFRDQYLLTNSFGQAFVRFYYRNSPPIAAIIAGSQPLKILVRVILAPVIAAVYLLYHPVLLLLVLVLLITIFSVRRSRLA